MALLLAIPAATVLAMAIAVMEVAMGPMVATAGIDRLPAAAGDVVVGPSGVPVAVHLRALVAVSASSAGKCWEGPKLAPPPAA
ncbi:hypothetical protein DF107_09085 [Burkholderia stagnalis]|nr:hypothetical protein DF161_20525 [Burkholderia stagnalis]RQR03964.1 hypothetical protein DF031_04470 [Burkholderia stagnalis]RQX93770.1 hypothetical protein DF120_10220 [Burkholderia stagnalis]RQY83006.1 hypothetical protein DF107_09085 [Burkholderia stagnalis]